LSSTGNWRAWVLLSNVKTMNWCARWRPATQGGFNYARLGSGRRKKRCILIPGEPRSGVSHGPTGTGLGEPWPALHKASPATEPAGSELVALSSWLRQIGIHGARRVGCEWCGRRQRAQASLLAHQALPGRFTSRSARCVELAFRCCRLID